MFRCSVHWYTVLLYVKGKGKGKGHPRKAVKAREGAELLLYSFFKLGARCGWLVNAKPRPLYRRKREEVPVVQGIGWSSWWVWTDAENLARHRDSIPGPTSL